MITNISSEEEILEFLEKVANLLRGLYKDITLNKKHGISVLIQENKTFRFANGEIVYDFAISGIKGEFDNSIILSLLISSDGIHILKFIHYRIGCVCDTIFLYNRNSGEIKSKMAISSEKEYKRICKLIHNLVDRSLIKAVNKNKKYDVKNVDDLFKFFKPIKQKVITNCSISMNIMYEDYIFLNEVDSNTEIHYQIRAYDCSYKKVLSWEVYLIFRWVHEDLYMFWHHSSHVDEEKVIKALMEID